MTRQRRRTLERQQDVPLLSSSDLSSSKSSLRMETTSSLLETSEPEHSSAFRRVAATSSRLCHTSENQHAPQQPNPAKLALAKSPKRVSVVVIYGFGICCKCQTSSKINYVEFDVTLLVLNSLL